LGLVDLSEQKKISIIQIAVCIVLLLITGYVSYKYLLSPEIKKLHNARISYSKEKELLKSMASEAQRVNTLANNAQVLEAELVSMRNRVFNSDAEVLNFVRILPALALQSNNSLTSITPMEARDIVAPSTGSPAPSGGTTAQTTTQTAPPPPRTLSCSLKPLDVSFTGDYNAVIGFFNELKSMDQFVTVSSLSMSGGSEKASNINVKATLNLLKMGIVVNSFPTQIANLASNATNQAQTANKQQNVLNSTLTQNATKTIISNQSAIYAQRNAQTTVQVAKSPQNTAINQVPIPVSKPITTIAISQKTVTPVVQMVNRNQSPAISKQNTASVAVNKPIAVSAKITQPNQKLMPIQSTKQIQNNIQTEPKANTNKALTTLPKTMGNKINPIGKSVSAPTSKQPVVVAQKSLAESNIVVTTKSVVASVNTAQKTMTSKTQNQTTTVAKPSPKPVAKNTQFAVRVGKFAYYENAENLVKMLKSHEYSPWIKPYTNNGKTTYWVYVGAFETKEKAASFAESMQKRLAYIDDYVIMGVKSGKSKDS
jgi:cell division septation protein DedD/Tfp pilus assembly protein PilO